MTPHVEMQPLSQKKRRFVFLLSLILFVVAVPISVFYAIGYRFDFSSDITNIKSVGGMYVRNDTPDTDMFVNGEPVRDMRVFQRAAYIQNLEEGMHRIHVQGDGVQTWVKDLPVYAHYVTEVSSFNLPEVPQVRIITQWSDPTTGSGVIFDTEATSSFAFASVTAPMLLLSSTTATSTLVENPEYEYVQSRLASSTQERVLLQSLRVQAERFMFGSELASTTPVIPTATTTIRSRDYTLYERNGEVYVNFAGMQDDIPYYYCVLYSGRVNTSAQYGEHVYDQVMEQFDIVDSLLGSRMCRTDIRIDRLGQEVLWFDFFPGSTDIVLMLLEDGLYAVEVDDRAWQNTQRLYPGEDLQAVQDGGRIYVQDKGVLLEVYTQIASQ